jgi:hypothetical protein
MSQVILFTEKAIGELNIQQSLDRPIGMEMPGLFQQLLGSGMGNHTT